MVEQLRAAFAHSPIALTDTQADLLAKHYDILMEANRSMNLTAIASEEEAALLHYLDSASPLFFGYLKPNDACCDVGSGAGFPGIVLAILRPDCAFTLMDSQTKRVNFLTEAVKGLSLNNAEALHIRAEDAGRDGKHRERYDIVLSRAVAPLPTLCEFCLPLVKIGGHMIAFKGPAAEEELKSAKRAMEILGADRAEIKDSGISGRSHHLIRIEKHAPPRRCTRAKPERRKSSRYRIYFF